MTVVRHPYCQSLPSVTQHGDHIYSTIIEKNRIDKLLHKIVVEYSLLLHGLAVFGDHRTSLVQSKFNFRNTVTLLDGQTYT